MSANRAGDARGVLIAKVVSGGETGADRAAVDFAISHNVTYGGWVPRDGWAEDLRDPPGLLALYDHFVPTQSADPGVRTTLNVRDSTATVVFSPPIATSPGVTQTLQMASVLKRPIIVIDPSFLDADASLQSFFARLDPEATLNVAGPRESEVPSLYRDVIDLLNRNLSYFVASSN
jgi:Circularly permutated YpsA SLOG family